MLRTCMAFHRKRVVAYWVITFERAKIKLKIIYGAVMSIDAGGNHNKWFMIKAFKSLNFNNLQHKVHPRGAILIHAIKDSRKNIRY
jgi:hypothetical protein